MQSVDDNSYNLLVYIDTGSSPKLIRLKKDKKKNVVQEVIATYEGRNSVDVSKMKEVINTAFSEYPAQSYGLVCGLMEKDGWQNRRIKPVGGDRMVVQITWIFPS